jgi:hypothetical protein
VVITTIGIEAVIVRNMNFVRRGVVIGFATNLGCGLNGFLAGRNLKNLGLPTVNTGVIGTP